jgi:hypothetical protein
VASRLMGGPLGTDFGNGLGIDFGTDFGIGFAGILGSANFVLLQ